MEAIPWLFVLALTIGYAWWLLANEAAENRAKLLTKARIAYEEALGRLRAQPTDATFRQAALNAGRIYSNLSRESKGVTIFDEMALKNDLDAAAAGAPTVAALAPVAQATSVAERLRTLADLKTQGLITEEEYLARRKNILEEV
jgi:hypothetical protein